MYLSIKVVFILVTMFVVLGCGGDSSSTTNTKSSILSVTNVPNIEIVDGKNYSQDMVALSGRITYDLVPTSNKPSGLNYDAITKEPCKWVEVLVLHEDGNTLGRTFTDENGRYHFNAIPSSTNVQIQVRANMLRDGSPAWKVEVLDNTNNNALYAMQGDLASTGERNSTHDLHAESGWAKNGFGYTSTRTAAPFAILDTIHSAMKTVLSAEENASFAPLKVFWSIKNKTTSDGNLKEGHIGTSYYQNRELYILGDENADTDEYDDHVIAHEWGHFYEDTFSRSDSIGGSHTIGDSLDIRLAFSEAWGNAFSAMALGDSIYVDTISSRQSKDTRMDIEESVTSNPGYFSEASIQHILYDIYDSVNDSADTLSIGFSPIHQVLTHAQKNTPAFTSIFPFILGIQALKPELSEQIDGLVGSENISKIVDIWGTWNSKDLYKTFTMGKQSMVEFDYSNDNSNDGNKLGNHSYYKFTITNAGLYNISVNKLSGDGDTDPDFVLYSSLPSVRYLYVGQKYLVNKEEKTIHLKAGQYILDINDANHRNRAQFTLDITPQ